MRVRREWLCAMLAVALPAALALALCLYRLGSRSLWLDEAASAAIAGQHGSAFGAALARDGGNMLGYYALLHALIGGFGNGVVVLRLPSALAAAFAAGSTAALARRLWGSGVGVLAGILAAVSLSLVYWGQNARGYAAMVALVAGSCWAWVTILDSDRPRLGLWAAYVACTTAAVYAALAAALIVPAQLAVLAWQRRGWRMLVTGVAAVGLLCLPLAVLAARRGSSQLFWVPAPSLRTAKQVAQALTSSGLQPAYYTATGDALLILTGAVALVGVGRAALAARSPRGAARSPRGDSRSPRGAARSPRGDWGAAVIVAWLLVPLALDLIISLAGHSIFQARYALVSLPAMAILLAWTVVRTPWLPRVAAAGLLAALLALRTIALAPSYGVSTERWRTAADFLVAHARRGDCIAFYPLDARMPIAYYAAASGRLPRPILPALPWSRMRPYLERYRTLTRAELAALRPGCARIWLVWSHAGSPGGPPAAARNFRRLRVLRAELAARYPASRIRTFGRASPITVELFTAAG